VQGRYRFSDRRAEGGAYAFSNCHDQLRPYRNHPLVPHCGAFTPEACISQASPNDAVIVPAGSSGQELRVTSSGTPVLKVTSPGGRTSFTTPSQPGQRVDRRGSYLATLAPDTHQLLILLVRPQAGRWRLDPVAGTPPIGSVEMAGEVPPPLIRARVAHVAGSGWVLAYRIGNFVAGSRVRFLERGKDSARVLGIAGTAAGRIRFVPRDALGRARTIEADVQAADGTPNGVSTVARFIAPPAVRAGRPGRVVITRHGAAALVKWAPAANARQYIVLVRGGDGRVNEFVTGARTRTVTIQRALPFDSSTATVHALGGANLLAGPEVAGRLRALRVKPVRLPRHAHRLARLPGTLTP
jgi:hypothetical protein